MAKNKGGRPKKKIDQNTFEGLCKIQCTKSEVTAIFECDEKTITAWCKETYGMGFCDIRKEKSQAGLAGLRRGQFKMAEKNATMSIWLGKQYLGQKDKSEVDNKLSGEVKSTIDTSKLKEVVKEVLAEDDC